MSEPSTVAVKSTPDGADITVDGKYVGSTPSTLRLAAGDHTIAVEKSGFKPWQRTVTVSEGGNINIDATLEKTE
ncbi:MAG TPA: PEGA domain-containing protein [Terriglobia bacterium]|nr:PEGA domain-containing protein [Terriglobia bacterium]